MSDELKKKIVDTLQPLAERAFCPTGEGGGIDNSCSPNEGNEPKTLTKKQANKELHRLSGLIKKYAHRWGEEPSQRLLAWIQAYNDIKLMLQKNNRYDEWITFCEEIGAATDHDGYDHLA